MTQPLVQRVRLQNFKSFERCDVKLSAMTVLVGRNGAGKSNFLDALEFTKDAVEKTLDFAVRERAGIDGIRRRSRMNRPTSAHIEIQIEIQISIPHGYAIYGFQLGDSKNSYNVRKEKCLIRTDNFEGSYRIERGEWTHWSFPDHPQPAAIEPDRLALQGLSGIPEIRPVYDAIVAMAFHNLNPDMMKNPVRPDTQRFLAGDGHNIPTIIEAIPEPEMSRIIEYLNRITGYNIQSIKRKALGSFDTLQIEIQIADASRPWTFDAASLSDGTLRALGILASASTPINGDSKRVGPRLIAIEEPENAIHPAAAAVLADALVEASQSRQILITTHSPDLIENSPVSPEDILVVVHNDGRSQIGKLSEAKMNLIRDHLSDPGELLRQDQMTPDPLDLQRQEQGKSLFDME
ncbi:MAG: AAA family ATPase [Phycisphaerales bacterium]|nr:AAA family ATPase [Phycisphaerales bacterium]